MGTSWNHNSIPDHSADTWRVLSAQARLRHKLFHRDGNALCDGLFARYVFLLGWRDFFLLSSLQNINLDFSLHRHHPLGVQDCRGRLVIA